MRKICSKLVPKNFVVFRAVIGQPGHVQFCMNAPHLFSIPQKVKSSLKTLKRHHQRTLSAVKETCTSTLKDLPESTYQGAFEK
ncbi:hypothetical protein NQ318_016169 [Aromia moschata]|uniref:Uncharacterized protein n=1 Tax=Aromia moschata TaxID=1265417 RepID=A0AAV8XZP0_9CUCU|nr:hypothetical protein NQ318_016169 [Aromia moschata]